MKFSNVLFFATAALAAPTMQAHQDKRQTTVLGTVQNIANTITASTAGNLANISKL